MKRAKGTRTTPIEVDLFSFLLTLNRYRGNILKYIKKGCTESFYKDYGLRNHRKITNLPICRVFPLEFAHREYNMAGIWLETLLKSHFSMGVLL